MPNTARRISLRLPCDTPAGLVREKDTALRVERLDSSVAANRQGQRALVRRIGQHLRHMLSVLARAERPAEAREVRFGAHAFLPCIRFRSRATDVRRTDELPQKKRLKSNTQVEIARDAVRVPGHQ